MGVALLQDGVSTDRIERIGDIYLKNTFGIVSKAFRMSGSRQVNEMCDGVTNAHAQLQRREEIGYVSHGLFENNLGKQAAQHLADSDRSYAVILFFKRQQTGSKGGKGCWEHSIDRLRSESGKAFQKLLTGG